MTHCISLSCSLVKFVVCKNKILAVPLIRCLFCGCFLIYLRSLEQLYSIGYLDILWMAVTVRSLCILGTGEESAYWKLLSAVCKRQCESEVNVWLVWHSKTRFLVSLLPTTVIELLKIYSWKIWLHTGAVAQCMM